jgi:hypothetical protein
MGKLSDETREKLQEILLKYLVEEVSSSTSKDIAVCGVKGLYDYTDLELVEDIEYRLFGYDDEEEERTYTDEDKEILALIEKTKAELKLKE